MYAVISSGGKQYKVKEREILRVETISGDIGTSVEFPEVLLLDNDNKIQIGTPYVTGAKVIAEIVAHDRGPKIRIIKFRRRKHHLKQAGHRQDFTEVKINKIIQG